MGNLNKRLPVLMTASISTRGMKGACFTDMEREDMYAEALSYYIQHLLSHDTSQRIVFAENSGWDLRSLKQKLPTYDKSRMELFHYILCRSFRYGSRRRCKTKQCIID